MANIGSLVADLRLESAAFNRDLGRATRAVQSNTAQMRRSLRQVEQSSRQVTRAVSQLRAGLVGLAGALAVRQFSQFTRQAIQSADAIAKTSRNVGLGAESFQAWQFGAEKAGVSTTQFTAAMQGFVRRVGEAQSGTGTLITNLKNLDQSTLDNILRSRNQEEALKAVADAIQNAGSATDRARIANAAFGRQGVQLIETLKGGSEGLERMTAEAKALGVVMSGDVIARAERANDALTTLGTVFRNAFNTQIIDQFSRAVSDSGSVLETAKNIGETFGRAVGTSMRGVATAAQFVAENFRAITAAVAAFAAFKAATLFATLAAAVIAYGRALWGAAAAQGALNAAMAVNPIGLVATVIAGAVAALVLFRDKLVTIGDTTATVGDFMVKTWQVYVEILSDAVARLGAIAAATAALAKFDFSGALRIIQESGERTMGLGQRIEAIWRQARKTIEDTVTPTQDMAGAVGELGRASAVADKKIGNLIDKLRLENEQLQFLRRAHDNGARAVQVANDAIEIQNTLVSAGVTLKSAEGREIYQLVSANRNLRREIDNVVDARKKEEDAIRRVAEARQREMERLAEENSRILMEPFLNAIRGIQDSFTSAFENIFNGGVRTFSDLANTIKRVFIRLAAELATLQIFNRVLPGVVGGAGLGGVFSGVGSSLNRFGTNFGFSSGVQVIPQPGGDPLAVLGSGAGLFGDTTFSQFLGGAGLGFGAGALLSSLTGGGTGGTIGSGVGGLAGAAIGSIIPGLGTMLGGLIGGAGGGLLGGLFGGKPSVGPNANATLGFVSGVFSLSQALSDNSGNLQGAIQAGNKAAEALNAIVQQLGGTVLSAPGAQFIDFAKKGGFSSVVGGVQRTFGQDAEAALNDLIVRVLKGANIQGISDTLATVLRNTQARTIEALSSDIEFGRMIDDLVSPLSTLDRAIRDVNMRFNEMIVRAQQLGLSTQELVQLREREIEALRFQARAPFLEASAGIVGFLQSQSLSADSTLNPVARLTEAQRQFDDLLQRVRGGEVGLAASLTQSANQLLALGRQNFASSVDFAQIEGFVRSSLLSVAETIASDDFFAEAMRQSTEVQVGAIDRTTEEVAAVRREIQLLRQALAA